MHRIILPGLAIASTALNGAAPAMSTAVATQVMVGSDDLDFDACGGVGVVAGLNPRGDNFLSVRSSPSTSGRELFRLKTGHPVNLCDVSEDGKWLGVVFQPAEDEQDFGNCGVGTPLPRQPYSGPCQQGWVSGRYIELVAG